MQGTGPAKADQNEIAWIQTLLDGATFTVDNGGKIDAVGSDAQIDAADVSASNGIIHEIDTVLLPLDLDL